MKESFFVHFCVHFQILCCAKAKSGFNKRSTSVAAETKNISHKERLSGFAFRVTRLLISQEGRQL